MARGDARSGESADDARAEGTERGAGSGPEMPGDMTRVRETWKMRGRWIREGGGLVGGAAGRDDKTRKE